MNRRLSCLTAFVLLALALSPAPPASALDEPDRLWLVGERAFTDGLHALARRALERFVADHPADRRLPGAVLLLGKARLALGDGEAALEALRRAQTFDPPPGQPLEGKFWEAEALFRLKRVAEARTAYDEVLQRDAASPLAPDALYGRAWCDLELKRAEAAVASFSEFIKAWPDHAQVPSATFYLARSLVDLRRWSDALPLLTSFLSRFPGGKLAPDARYLLGWARVTSGDPRGGLADLRAFVAAHPTHDQAPAARRMITETLARYGDRDELLETYKTLMEETPTPEGLYDAGAIAARLGRPRDQDAAWRKLRKEFPEHPLAQRAALDLATAAFKRRDWKEAAALAHAASQSEETAMRAEALLLSGESELKLRRFSTAVKAFEAVGGVKNVEASVRYRALAGLGLAREEQREWRAALAAYESVATRSPDVTLREWARERATAVRGRLPKSGAAPAEKAPAEKKVEKKGTNGS
jgi:TolA-binding protein